MPQHQPIFKPALGRFDISKSLLTVDLASSLLPQMRKVQRLFWPFLATSVAAFGLATLPDLALAASPPGFEQFDSVYPHNFV